MMRTRNLLLVTAVPVLLCAAGAWLLQLTYNEVKDHTIADYNSRQMLLLEQSAIAVENFFRSNELELRSLSRIADMAQGSPDCQQILDSYLEIHSEQITRIARLDLQGNVLHEAGIGGRRWRGSPLEEEHWRNPGSAEMQVSEVFYNELDEAVLLMQVPVRSADSVTGMLAIELPFSTITRDFIHGAGISNAMYPLVVSDQLLELYCPSEVMLEEEEEDEREICSLEECAGDNQSLLAYGRLIVANPQGSGSYVLDLSSIGGGRESVMIAAHQQVSLPGSGWSISIATPQDEILQSLALYTRLQWTVLSIGALILGGFMLIMLRSWNLMRERELLERSDRELRDSRQRAVDALERYEQVVSMIPDIFWRVEVDRAGNLRSAFLSPAAAEILGLEGEADSHGLARLMEMVLPEDMPALTRMLAVEPQRDRQGLVEFRIRRSDGRIIWLRTSSSAEQREDGSVLLAGISQDITGIKRAQGEREELEEKLRQSMKLEAIGNLAGGIAHDFNNILLSISGNSHMALQHAGEDSPAGHHLQQIELATERAAQLVNQILTFARRNDRQRSSQDVSMLLGESMKLLRPSIPSSVEIITRLRSERSSVLADPIEIQQILMNLCSNAAQAMEPLGGRLEIELSMLTRAEARAMAAGNELDNEQGYLQISVSDTGPGMSEELQAKVFDPFFTTKEAGQGTGLGLAVVHGITRALGGEVLLESTPGLGSTFRVLLPLSDEAQPQPSTSGRSSMPRGTERLMLVDDEPAILMMLEKVLQLLGYATESFSSGNQALEAFRHDPDAYELVVTDQTMPHGTGDRLIQGIRELRPEQRVILCTGFSNTVDAQQAENLGVQVFLRKPFTPAQLAQAVRSTLDGNAGIAAEQETESARREQ
ncbi:MAG: ATP-binding protein [bacterium]